MFIRTSKSTEENEPIISVSGAELVSTENYTPFEFYFLNAGNKKMIGNKPSDDDDTLYITYKDNKISLSNKKTDFSNKLFDVTLTDDKAITVSPPTTSSGYY